MKITMLGTGAAMPSKDRNVTSMYIDLSQEINEGWLVDCGEGTQTQILNTSIRPRKIRRIFITHTHGDHILGLPGLLLSMSNLEKEDDLDIYAPKGLKEYLEMSFALMRAKLAFKINYHELEKNNTYQLNKFKVFVFAVKHDIQTFGFRFMQDDLEGTLDINKAIELGVPKNHLLGELKSGKDVILPNGNTVRSTDVVSEKRKGKQFAILGDTGYFKELASFINGVDVLIHEATLDIDAIKSRKLSHSTPLQAAQVALEGNVGRLYLTHISNKLKNKELRKLENMARNVFSETKYVHDFMEIEI